MSKPPRIDRKTLKGPDEFQKKGTAILDFVALQRGRFLAVLSVLALAVVAVFGWDFYAGHRLDRAWVAYDEAVRAPEAERWDKLKAVHSSWGNIRPTYFAAIALADHYFDDGKRELLKNPAAASTSAPLAVEWYNHALDFKGALPTERQLVTLNRGNSYELMQKYDEAFSDYKKASDMEGEEKAFALLNLARGYELKKDIAKAEETYQKISADFVNTEYGRVAKNQLRRLKSPLFAGNHS